jgi:uncharacterized membrane protein YfcA
MSTMILVLMVVSIGISAYVRGRKEGTWSWPLFLKTLLGLWILCAAIGVLIPWIGRKMGPDHALEATILIVLLIAAGVVALTLWVKKRTPRKRG